MVGALHTRFISVESKVIAINTTLNTFIGDVNDWSSQLTKALNKLSSRLSILEYGQSQSPIILKDKYKDIIKKTYLDTQIKKNINILVDWLKQHHPATGLDAQNLIYVLVSSGEIEKYLDLTQYKQYLYEAGKTQSDAEGILGIYLFEILIPRLHLLQTYDSKRVKKSS